VEQAVDMIEGEFLHWGDWTISPDTRPPAAWRWRGSGGDGRIQIRCLRCRHTDEMLEEDWWKMSRVHHGCVPVRHKVLLFFQDWP
jgi:hypothetical protein